MMHNRFVIFLLLMFVGSSVVAEMGGGQHMGNQQRSHMMSQDAMHNMTQMMHRMTDMTQNMTRMMEQSRTMDPQQLRDMSHVMERLSTEMHSLSQHMKQGKMDKKVLKEMDQHMEEMHKMIRDLGDKS